MADTSIRLVITAATEEIKKSLEDLKKQFGELGSALGKSTDAGHARIIAGLQQVATETRATNEHLKEHHGLLGIIAERGKEVTEVFNKLAEAAEFVGGGFLALKAVGLVTEFLQVSARTETLAVALHNVGQNAGYSAAQLDEADKAVQKLGISAESSRQSLIQLIQSGISTDLAAPLARASQDLAVIAGMDSSETFKRLVTNIQQLDSEGLRFMGIMVDREAVFARAMQETGRTVDQFAQRQVFANAVLAEAAKLTGTYESAMETAGKALTSFPRIIEEFKDAVGSLGQGAWAAMVFGAKDVIEALTELARSFKEASVNEEVWGESAVTVGGDLGILGNAIHALAEEATNAIKFLEHHKEAIKELGRILVDTAKVAAVVYGIILGESLLAGGVRLATFLVATLGPAVRTLALAFTLASTAGTTFAVVMETVWAAVTGPVGLAVLAVGAISGLVYLFNKSGDESKKAAEGYKTQTDAINAYVEAMKRRLSLELQLSSIARQHRERVLQAGHCRHAFGEDRSHGQHRQAARRAGQAGGAVQAGWRGNE
jgi:hypothetical protein